MQKLLSLRLLFVFFLWSFLVGFAPIAMGQQGLVRDSEIEQFLQDLAAPVLEAANYPQGKIKIYAISDPTINAFVAGGDYIFVHTGLIVETNSPEEITGVLAHELGHILAGHVAQSLQSQYDANRISLASTLTAIAAGLASKDVGVAVLGAVGGSDVATKTYLGGVRLREIAADQIAADLLHKSEISPKFIKNFLDLLASKEVGINYDQYLLSHPISKDRVAFFNHQIKTSPYKDKKERVNLAMTHKRMKIKIIAYSHKVDDVLRSYSGQSNNKRYAQMIAYYRNHNFQRAVSLIESLIAEEANNPYLYELRAELMIQVQKYKDAIQSYHHALELLRAQSKPTALLHYQLAVAIAKQIFHNRKPPNLENAPPLTEAEKRNFKQAQIYAYRALNADNDIGAVWQLLGTIHEWLNQPSQRDLARAEYAFRLGELKRAAKFATQSKNDPQIQPTTLLRAEDILLQIANIQARAQP